MSDATPERTHLEQKGIAVEADVPDERSENTVTRSGGWEYSGDRVAASRCRKGKLKSGKNHAPMPTAMPSEVKTLRGSSQMAAEKSVESLYQ